MTIKLDIGAGGNPAPGFTSVDRKNGLEAYPLTYDDESIDTIRASHVLEHFPAHQVPEVVKHWVSKLVPGGLLKIAVPNLEWIAREYLKGSNFNVQGYLMGGQVDQNDYHHCAFDAENLTELLLDAGLERIHVWESEQQDCASLPVSLNLAGYKPSGTATHCEATTAVLSAPRYGPVIHMRCASTAFSKARVPYQIAGGAYWHQVLSELLESQIEYGSKYIITCDYDTVFSHEDVMELYRLMEAMPDIDAICPLQSKRGEAAALFGIHHADGRSHDSIPSYQLDRHTLPITIGHFGLTIFRASSLAALDRPWMNSIPSKAGRWGEGKVDADIQFWHHWKQSGMALHLAPRVVVGHIQELITWPGRDLMPIYQLVSDYDQNGMPQEARK